MKKNLKTTIIAKQSRKSSTAEPQQKMVVELWCGETLLGEVFKENDGLTIEIFPLPKELWKIDFKEFLTFLNNAKRELLQKID